MLFYAEPHKYQMWAYIYQARDLLAMDESGMNGKNAIFALNAFIAVPIIYQAVHTTRQVIITLDN